MARTSRRWGAAGFFVLLGIVLLLFTTDAVDSIDLWTWLPGLFVLLGAWSLTASRGRNLTGPVLVIVVAGAFLLRNLGYLPKGFISTYWPAVFVLLGALVLLNRGRRRHGHTASANGEFTSVSIFGGDSQHVGGNDFRGGDVVAIFGGPTINLRDATAAEKPAVLEIVSVFGGAEIRVPRTGPSKRRASTSSAASKTHAETSAPQTNPTSFSPASTSSVASNSPTKSNYTPIRFTRGDGVELTD